MFNNFKKYLLLSLAVLSLGFSNEKAPAASEALTAITANYAITANAVLNAPGAESYSTGWISRSDWTSVSMGSSTTKNADSNVAHNLGENLTDGLFVGVYVSTDGTEANAFQVLYSVDEARSNDQGVTLHGVDTNNIKVQTGSSGFRYTNDAGANLLIDTQDWYYKIVVKKI